MIEWVKILKESPIDWLLEKTNPSVQYFTLRDILDKDENDSPPSERYTIFHALFEALKEKDKKRKKR